jgi:two-component system phosphate regulon sensor histidine kinase PhoR
LALFLIAIISTIIASRLTLPIHRLVQVAEEIKQGNTQARFDDTRGDEISELAELLNQMLNKLQEDLVRLKQLERMRSQFLGNVSHELRTPIFSVQGYLETLMQNPISDPKKQQKFIQNAYRQAVRLNNLLTDLIDISRIESGEMKMTFERFPVYDWLRRIVVDMEETASKNDVNLQLVNEPENHLHILGDRERLTQVIQNLVTNAIKYNVPNGWVKVGYAESKNRVEIYVADSGRGIAKEHLPRIFERFYRVDKERSRQVGGTGLGLAIVKHIIEAHGSKVSVESQVGVGSRFHFTIKSQKSEGEESEGLNVQRS